MEKMKTTSVDQYIAQFPVEVQVKLQQIRQTILDVVPMAIETISYQMPAYKLKSYLVYFAAFKKHIGFYPTYSGIENFKDQFLNYKFSKGCVQFPIDQEIPLDLVRKIVEFRVAENKNK